MFSPSSGQGTGYLETLVPSSAPLRHQGTGYLETLNPEEGWNPPQRLCGVRGHDLPQKGGRDPVKVRGGDSIVGFIGVYYATLPPHLPGYDLHLGGLGSSAGGGTRGWH